MEPSDLGRGKAAPDLCEEGLLWLAHHRGSTVASVLQSRHKGPGTEGQTVLTSVVATLVDGDERSSVQDQPGMKQKNQDQNLAQARQQTPAVKPGLVFQLHS